jgi:hypothetical protein
MRRLVIALVVLLIVFHQDFWWWDDVEPLVFGFLPIGLAYHAALSIAAAIVWALAVWYCWPADVEVAESQWLEGPPGKHKEL